MPPQEPLQFPPPTASLLMNVPGDGISPLKLRLKPVRIGPIPGGSGNLTSYAQAGFSPARS